MAACVLQLFRKSPVILKIVPKAAWPVILKIVLEAAGHECTLKKIDQ
jgi:hypothetical protein